MKVAKWGNSLAIRLSAQMADKLGVKEGDELQASPGFSEEQVVLRRKKTREELWKRVEEIRRTSPIPADYKFTRADAYDDDEY